jgi:predicted PurR-regulated permease PerM
LFGFLTFVASLVPVVGTLLVWVPAAIYLFATDQTTIAIVFVAWSVLAVGGADNVLRPLLIGSRVEMPQELTMLGALGGLFAFGMLGLVIGPLIIAAALLAFRLLVATHGSPRDGG